jgi:ubiquitin-protein ligase
MSNKRYRLSNMSIISAILSPMIPIWVPKKRYSEPPARVTGPEIVGPPKAASQTTKECAICRKSNADYEHSCGVAFHKACIRQYFEALSTIDGAEKICPHCYEPFPYNLDSGADSAVEVSTILDEVYNQYIELSDKFSIALIDGRIRDVSVFLASPTDDEYFINVDFGFYPKKPTFSFPDDLLANMDGLTELLERLNNWDSSYPPRIVDEILDIQSRIRPKEISEFQEKETVNEISKPEKEIEETVSENKEQMDYVEVLPEEEIVEVSLEDEEKTDSNLVPFFDLMPESEAELPEFTPYKESFENEEAIAQYLDLSNSFSVELIDDEIYNVIVHLSSIDSGIYNIYPITINFKKYPQKPQIMLTDDLLVRIRNLDGTLTKLKFWDALNPAKIVDILKEIETKLMEDSLVENEIEMVKREFNTRRITKNRIVITLTSYGQKSFDVELNLKYYPQPPLIYFPSELKQIQVEELEGIKMWASRPQKRIMDVLRSLSHAINNIYRLEFEESLLRMIADEFIVMDDGYQIKITVPLTKDEDPEVVKSSSGELLLRINVPNSYPLSPPKIEIDSDSEDLTNDARVFLAYLLKSWSPSMFISDAVNRLSLSLSNTSLYKCLICGQKECPSCGQSLLTVPVKDSQEICEVPCIHCKRPYHVHCLTEALDMGMKKCGFCLTDLHRFFGSRLHNIVR